MRESFAKLLKTLRRGFPDVDLDVVREAYRCAVQAHEGQERWSGEPFVLHSIAVAQNLAQLGLDPVTCAAGLLHDVLEDTSYTEKELKSLFGPVITQLVDGVTKISGLSFPDDVENLELKQAQNIRKMLVATAKDVRVILIKLADRLHNMRTLEHLPREKRLRTARETLDIYAPLAHRLGISRWRWELEDRAFQTLRPDEYHNIAKQVAMKRRAREAELRETVEYLERRLSEAEVVARVIGRPKHLYSIYRKMRDQGKDFDEVMDIQAVRIITQTEGGCYNALGAVHGLWMPVPGRLKDFIAMPKMNMYQAIHTTVMREGGRAMEVQIRSEEMDHIAAEGIAAHWNYKEGFSSKDAKLDDKLRWLRQMYEWLKDAHAPEGLMDAMRKDMADDHIYIFTPKSEVMELPVGATPLDFAYLIHSDVGHQCIGAKINGRMVPLRYHLQTGDVVEILRSKNQVPHVDWINIVLTGRARTRIRQRLRELGLLDAVNSADAKATQEERPHKQKPPAKPAARIVQEVDDATRKKLIRVDGKKGLAVEFAKCCHAMPGHAVLGYVTRSPGISIHRADCKSFAKSNRDPARILPAAWAGEQRIRIALRLVMGARPNVLADITQVLRPLNLSITEAHFGPDEHGHSYFDFEFESDDERMRDVVPRALRKLRGVTSISQVDGTRFHDVHENPAACVLPETG